MKTLRFNLGDSMLSGIDERRVSKRDRKINGMYDYIKPLLKKCPDNIILHVGTVTRLMSHPR